MKKKNPTQEKSDVVSMFKQYFEQARPSFLNQHMQREEAFKQFEKMWASTLVSESWRHINTEKIFKNPPAFSVRQNIEEDTSSSFHCIVDEIEAIEYQLVNGHAQQQGVLRLDNGVIYGNMNSAIERYPDLVLPHFNADNHQIDGFSHLNSAFWGDGFFLYIPKNVKLSSPIQLVNIYNPDKNLMVNVKNLIVLEPHSKLTLIHCDDSVNLQQTLSNVSTEVVCASSSEIDYYKLQNINNETTLINRLFFEMSGDSMMNFNQVSLNGGILRNDIHTMLNEPFAKAEISGLYLMDKAQQIDNQVYVKHTAPECFSNQRFKGIIDDYATANFSGNVYVNKGAQHTEAHQNCRNILLTDKARVETKPFLEIYADDVKCSHGASVGQLDSEAMFYLRTRGLGLENARMLLLYAFATEIIDRIQIAPLKERYTDMIQKRLSGDLSICEQCVLNCTRLDTKYDFDNVL